MSNIALAAKAAVTVVAVATAMAAHRALFSPPRDRALAKRAAVVLGGITLAAVIASHVDVVGAAVARVFPLGLVGGLALAVATLFMPGVRAAFDELRDGDVRLLVGTRAAFGSLLLLLGGAGVLPESFALGAGLGDLVAASLAIGAPGTLDRSGSRVVRAVVHGFGALDMAMVVAQAMLVVRPWANAHPGLVTSMTLPWLVVPLMVAVDLHGLRKVFAPTRVTQLGGDGSQPARRLRSALP